MSGRAAVPARVLVAGGLALACEVGCSIVSGPEGTTTAPAGGLVPVPAVGAASSATCSVPVPAAGGLRLRRAEVARTAGALRFAVSLAAPLPAGGPVVELAVGLWDAAGSPRWSLSVRFTGGRPREEVYDVVTADLRHPPDAPQVQGAVVSAVFPRADVEGVGRGWTWQAFADVDGVRVDDCPVR